MKLLFKLFILMALIIGLAGFGIYKGYIEITFHADPAQNDVTRTIQTWTEQGVEALQNIE